MKNFDLDVLSTLRTFASQFDEQGVPFTELMSQLYLVGHWPKIRNQKGINLKMYARADLQLKEATDRLLKQGYIEQSISTHYVITESGEKIAIAADPTH